MAGAGFTEPESIRKMLTHLGEPLEPPPVDVLPNSLMSPDTKTGKASVRAGSAGCGPIATAKTIEILARIRSGEPPMVAVPRIQENVREARLFLEQNPGGLPVIDELIQRFEVSRTHFFRAFKQQTGPSPYKYRLQLTMRRAGELLRNSTLSVKAIAFSLGFNSAHHFSKLFKSKVGVRPPNIAGSGVSA